MKLFLDTNALAYLSEISSYVPPKNKIFDEKKYKLLLSKSEIITDGIVVFELFNKFPNDKEKFFEKIKEYDATFYGVAGKKNSKILKAFQNARDNRKYDSLFKELIPIVVKEYTRQLSILIWHLLTYWLGLIEFYNDYKKNPSYVKFATAISNILRPAESHLRKIFKKNIIELINQQTFNQDKVNELYDKFLGIICYYFNEINFSKKKESEFLKELNIIKDKICYDKFNNKYNCEYNNFILYQNYYSSCKKSPKIYISKTYQLNLLKDGEVSSIIRNKLLNQIEIRKNKKKNFNDLKDLLIAEHYLQYINEDSSGIETRFITFDNLLIKSLEECTDKNIIENISLIKSFMTEK